VGALYVRRSTPIQPLLFGGGQERGLRATTENVPGIIGFAEALRVVASERDKESFRIAALRDRLHSYIHRNVGMTREVVVNGSLRAKERLPNNLNISFPHVDTEMLTLELDAAGIAVSTKSSCLRDERASYVVAALGGGKSRAESSIRFTLGRQTTARDIAYAARTLGKILHSKH
jgi:cysteine desulfurase